MSFVVSHELPSVEDYCALRVSSGLSAKDEEAARVGLKNSNFCVTVRDGQKLIGMGRVVGDGGCFVQIVDIAVHPEFQKNGLGRKIMEEIMTFVKDHLPKSCFVSLFADVGFLYEKFGFIPSEKSKGMYLDRSKI
jgi:ribosomal protein S18 acetylase RimI-like enzyme